MNRKLDSKKRKRKAARAEDAKRRRRGRLSLEARLNDWKPKDKEEEKPEPIRVNEEAPMPGRNDPCPIHAEHKLKKCPHGCLQMFLRNRSRVANDTIPVAVEEDDERAGMVGKEYGHLGAIADLTNSLGN